jgi:hypothetical protein
VAGRKKKKRKTRNKVGKAGGKRDEAETSNNFCGAENCQQGG